MIISLIGFMGCGKSSVGRGLSQLLCCPFIDLDEAVVEAAGKSIPEIFAEDGEAGFRQMELEVLNRMVPMHSRGPLPLRGSLPLAGGGKMPLAYNRHTSNKEHLVLALGGGTVMTPDCADLVRENTFCIYLRASVNTLMERLASDTESRPLLRPYASPSMQGEETRPAEDLQLRNRIETLLAERSATYEKTAKIIIDTDGKSVNAIAHEILANF
jgi:shikimate kinase